MKWDPVVATEVVSGKISPGRLTLPEGIDPPPGYEKGDQVVASLTSDGQKSIQCVIVVGEFTDDKIRVSPADSEKLGLTAKVTTVYIRKRTIGDGLSNLKSAPGRVALLAAPLVVAILALLPGAVWPAPSSSNAAQVDAIWQKASATLIGPPGAGLLGRITSPAVGASPALQEGQARAQAQGATATLSAAAKDAATAEAAFKRSTASKLHDHNVAVTVQLVAGFALAVIVFGVGGFWVFKGR